VIELTDWLRAELTQRADAEAPQECCGLISRGGHIQGDGELPLCIWVAENVAEDPERGFEIAPDQLLRIIRHIEGTGETLVGVYHSHPAGVASPSPEDVATAARWPGLTWLIVARQPCPNCDGSGTVDGVEPECCGNTTTSGECRGDCAVPRQVEEACPCGGEVVSVFWNGVLA